MQLNTQSTSTYPRGAISQGTATSSPLVSPMEFPGALTQAQGKAGQVPTETNNRDLFSHFHIHTYSTLTLSYFKTENLMEQLGKPPGFLSQIYYLSVA